MACLSEAKCDCLNPVTSRHWSGAASLKRDSLSISKPSVGMVNFTTCQWSTTVTVNLNCFIMDYDCYDW